MLCTPIKLYQAPCKQVVNYFILSSGRLLNESESLFNYTGGNDTFEFHNPSDVSAPPFLEELVAAQRNDPEFNSRVTSCTSSTGVLSTTCLYDFLLTDNENIAAETMDNEETAEEVLATIGIRAEHQHKFL